MNRYRFQDLMCMQLARMMSDVYKQAFLVAIGSMPGFDMVSADGEIVIEAKFETTPARTGNVCIEFWNTDLDKPSGILGTKADLWVHVVQEGSKMTAFEYRVDVLRRLVIETGTLSSNGRNSIFKLIPLEIFRNHAQKEFVFEAAAVGALPPKSTIGDTSKAVAAEEAPVEGQGK